MGVVWALMTIRFEKGMGVVWVLVWKSLFLTII